MSRPRPTSLNPRASVLDAPVRSGTPSPSETRSSTPNRPAATAPFHPTADTATYRDLLLFEERLKMNAEMLRRRRRRYSEDGVAFSKGGDEGAFLYSCLAMLVFTAHRLVLHPPQDLLTVRALQVMLAVVIITLVLFFASGMYEEKIRYAHSYINHSNKALRPLNMHLNMKRPRLTPATLLAYLPFSIPFLGTLPTSSISQLKPPTAPPAPIKTRRLSSNGVMATIPPSNNPRGELIFSSRVDRSFREGYERYRAAFERRREEKAREEARLANRGRWFGFSTGHGRKGVLTENGATPALNRTMTPTPPLSRRGTPPPGISGATTRGRTPSPGASGLRHGHGKGAVADGIAEKEGRSRAESYSFVWSATDTTPRRAP
ncbi:hypothetical protein BCR39DRAFT_556037 [Naematelia encephala]|uniref:Transmembrane protein 188 n=1 Tax=Naematelia encephala TaxID=71784 RepID=A0A1Y2BMF1_9TREE|nr:hypothetical protein BCR39DRAFT_556037 [Naematelia encephala]